MPICAIGAEKLGPAGVSQAAITPLICAAIRPVSFDRRRQTTRRLRPFAVGATETLEDFTKVLLKAFNYDRAERFEADETS